MATAVCLLVADKKSCVEKHSNVNGTARGSRDNFTDCEHHVTHATPLTPDQCRRVIGTGNLPHQLLGFVVGAVLYLQDDARRLSSHGQLEDARAKAAGACFPR
jgi:hypothetical protein